MLILTTAPEKQVLIVGIIIETTTTTTSTTIIMIPILVVMHTIEGCFQVLYRHLCLSIATQEIVIITATKNL